MLRFAEPLGLGDQAPALTREFAVEALRLWDREQSGRRRGEREYQAWTAGTKHPSLNALQNIAAFSELRIEALRLNAAGAPPLCRPSVGEAAAATPELLRAIAAGPTRTPGRAPARSVFRGPRPWLSHLIAAGLVSVNEQLVAEHAGNRYTATFDADGDITVAGHPDPVATLNQAVALITTSNTGGWQFWSVTRDGKPVPLAELRDQLIDTPDARAA